MSTTTLEEQIKNNLGNYEARDLNDWARMETMLGTTPDSSPFNWKPVLIIALVLGLLGGGYVAFTTLDLSKPTSKSTPAPAPVVKKEPVAPAKKEIIPVTPPPTTVVNTDSIKKAEEEAAALVLAKEEEERKQKEEAEKEEARLKKEKRKEELSKEDIELRRARRKALANSDSNRTNKTNDSSREVKASEKKEKSTAVGLNIFSTIHADSLKKYQDKLKKDSVK